jgi:hypothetical protein
MYQVHYNIDGVDQIIKFESEHEAQKFGNSIAKNPRIEYCYLTKIS